MTLSAEAKPGLKTAGSVFLFGQLMGCAGRSVNPRTVKSHGVDFSRYQTFVVLPEPPKEHEMRRPKSVPRQVVEPAVRHELLASNYRENRSKDQAGMSVAIQHSLLTVQQITVFFRQREISFRYQGGTYERYCNNDTAIWLRTARPASSLGMYRCDPT